MKKTIAPILFLFLSSLVGSFAVDFEKQISPLLEDRCLDCHGPDKQKSELRVDQRPVLLKGGDSGLPAIVPGNPAGSFLIELIKSTDTDERMPPKGDALTADQIALLETWIEEGAEWPGQMDAVLNETTDLWSFQPVTRPSVPANAKNPIDAFLVEKLQAKGLRFNDPADARSLLRRAAIVLTGLPPTPERVIAFQAAFSQDAEAAYTTLIDELLASPHFGERWAQHWLDVIRWAETNGSEANLYRKNAWIYRDYVVRSFNEDTPYDQFVREQLAGDQMGMGEATGFLVAGPHVPAATVGREPTAIRQARADRMDEIMQTVGASMLGVTVSCARCHNHKFDPISIKDYYAMTAVFQGVEFGGRYPEYKESHPRKQRSNELYSQIWQHRNVLRQNNKHWEEDWGAFRELHFHPVTVDKVRVRFIGGWGRLDELQVLGHPKEGNENFALESLGTVMEVGQNTPNDRSPTKNLNDGEFGTMGFTIKAIKGSKEKPYVQFNFTEPREIGRVRVSSNREYYYDTDYLEGKNGQVNLGDYRVEIQDKDGNWHPIGGTPSAKMYLKKDTDRREALAKMQEIIEQLNEEGPRTSFVGRFNKPGTTYVLHRGSPENPRDEVPPAGFSLLAGDLGLDSKSGEAIRRKKFADWVADPEHPLTARVMVNRIWHHVFGSGIVPTTADFGAAGAPPSHPELLEWLTAEWVKPENADATPWSMKTLIRQLMLTQAFRQSNASNSQGLEADAGAVLLWRFPPRRVEAEVIRDGILQASGKLDPRIGGRSFRIHNVKKTYAQWQVLDNHSPETWRRLLYQERMRRVDDQLFTAFDFPDCGQVRAKRPVSTTPLQALNLMNSPFVVEQSAFISERATKESTTTEGAIRRAFELVFNRQPLDSELAACLAVQKNHGLAIVCRSLINANEFAFLP